MEVILLLIGVVVFAIICVVALIKAIFHVIGKDGRWKNSILIAVVSAILSIVLLFMGVWGFGKTVYQLFDQGVNETGLEEYIDTKSLMGWPSGQYVVGKDLPAGEYVAVAQRVGFFEIRNQSNSILHSENFKNRAIVFLSDGQVFKVENAVLYAMNDVPKVEVKDVFLLDGMYKVGKDLPAGEYTAIANEQTGYIGIGRDVYDTNSMQGFVGEMKVTLADGYYIKLVNARIRLNM